MKNSTCRLCILFGLQLLGSVAGQTVLWSHPERSAGAELGTAVAGGIDFDRDGFDDVLAGAPGRGVVLAFSGKTGRRLFALSGTTPGGAFGIALANVGDVDRDGSADFAIGATGAGANAAGSVRVYSGRTRRLLWTWTGAAKSRFGTSVAAAGDIDGDGSADVLVGAPSASHTIRNSGVARVFSGKTGRVLHTFFGAGSFDEFGFAVAGGRDVDRDGRPDVIVGAYRNDKSASDAGMATVYSGRTGRVLFRTTGNTVLGGHGFSVGMTGDLNGDGAAEVLVGALWDDPAATDAGSVWVYSGRTGLPLRRLGGSAAFDGLGTSVANLGDVNGDGIADFAGGAVEAFPPVVGRTGYVRVWSGKDFRELYTVRAQRGGDWFGRSVAAAGDVNKDGVPDFVSGAPMSRALAQRGGSCLVVGGGYVALGANRATLSLTSGGVQLLSLDARPVHAGKTYWLLGSASRTRPGLAFDRVLLPLNPDAYFNITVVSPNTALLRSTLGKLNVAGQAKALFRLPRGLPAGLAGTKLQHAFLVFGVGGVDFASNPQALTLTR